MLAMEEKASITKRSERNSAEVEIGILRVGGTCRLARNQEGVHCVATTKQCVESRKHACNQRGLLGYQLLEITRTSRVSR